jgi:hypothetical protein
MDEERNGTPEGPATEPPAPEEHEDGGAAGAGETAETRVLSGEADQPTAVLPAEEPTRVMGAAPPPVSPPPPPVSPPPPPLQPTVTMTRRPTSNRSLWWVVIVLLIIAALLVAVFVLLRPDEGAAGQDFVGTWMPADASGGGLVIMQSGDAFTVTAYDAQIQPLGSGDATLSGDELVLTLPAAAFGVAAGEAMDVTLSYLTGQDGLHLVAQGGGARVERDYVLTDVLQPAQPTVAPTPTPTPTPTPSPTASPTASGSPPASADQQVIAGLSQILGGVTAWAANSNGVYPAATEVSPAGGVAQYVDPWPVNPFTGQPMSPGTAPGDYEYEQVNGGAGYRLVGHLSDGDVTYESTP